MSKPAIEIKPNSFRTDAHFGVLSFEKTRKDIKISQYTDLDPPILTSVAEHAKG